MTKTAIIIGAGPAGITAAYELLKNTDIKPIILEKNDFIGGISATMDYKGNKMDMGGHRFFSKSQKVMDFWLDIMPLQSSPSIDDIILDRKIEISTDKNAKDPEKDDTVMLKRARFSRIYYLKHFFDYPVSLNLNTILGLGFFRMVKIGFSYMKALFFKLPETNLENFFINRFGKELYLTFFKDYTEKLWGISCSKISAEWGAQRIKGISILKIIKSLLLPEKKQNVETSLIDEFYYPKFGPGQLWTTLLDRAKSMGAEVLLSYDVVKINNKDGKIVSIDAKNPSGEIVTIKGDYFLSTMPVKDLIKGIGDVPLEIKKVADGLIYRDFRTAGLLLCDMKIKNMTKHKTINNIIHDTWIYVQEKGIKMGRIQMFNNWSPYLVKDFKNNIFIGLEYFCNQDDELWKMADNDFIKMAIAETIKMGLLDEKDVIDSCSYKVEKAYPAYFGSYKEFDKIKNYVNSIDNLYLMGRNGMHRYNNMDHSVLSAMKTVENIKNGINDKDSVWQINSEQEYHEEKTKNN